MLRTGDVDVPVVAVAARRVVGHAIARVRPGPKIVLRTTPVAHHGGHTGRNVGTVDLAELVAAAIAGEDVVLAGMPRPAGTGDALGKERELTAIPARKADL